MLWGAIIIGAVICQTPSHTQRQQRETGYSLYWCFPFCFRYFWNFSYFFGGPTAVASYRVSQQPHSDSDDDSVCLFFIFFVSTRILLPSPTFFCCARVHVLICSDLHEILSLPPSSVRVLLLTHRLPPTTYYWRPGGR